MDKYLRHFIAHVICGLIPGTARRRRVRAILKSDWRMVRRVIRRDMGRTPKKLRRFVGHRGRYLVVAADDTYVYKFPIRNRDYRDMSMREMRITDALRHATKIAIPKMRVINENGTYIRRYEFMPGAQITDLNPDEIIAHTRDFAPQIAKFIYDIATSNPSEIRDLAGTDNAPGFMQGWFHNDICENFMFDANTYEITAMIDWEDARFMNFSRYFDMPRIDAYNHLMAAVKREYITLYDKNHQ